MLTGYGWIALGSLDTASAPVCDNSANGGGTSRTDYQSQPLPVERRQDRLDQPRQRPLHQRHHSQVGTTAGVTGPDYTGNWGLELGVNSNPTEGNTVDISKYTKVSFAFDTSGISPAPTGLIRGEIHVKGHTPADESYCATVTAGTAASLTAFNTKCWDGTGTNLTTDDMKNIDKMGIQISSDSTNNYAVDQLLPDGSYRSQ